MPQTPDTQFLADIVQTGDAAIIDRIVQSHTTLAGKLDAIAMILKPAPTAAAVSADIAALRRDLIVFRAERGTRDTRRIDTALARVAAIEQSLGLALPVIE